MKKLLFKLFFALAFTSISLRGQEKIQQVEVHIFGGMALYSSHYTINFLYKEFEAKQVMGEPAELPKKILLLNPPDKMEGFHKENKSG